MVAIFCILLSALAVNLSSSNVAQAAPAHEKRVAGVLYQILEPTACTVWTVGETATITWNNTLIPQDTFYSDSAGLCHSPSGSAWFVVDLADGFDLRTGTVSFTVPDVTPGNYFVMMSSAWGDDSPHFQIVAGDA